MTREVRESGIVTWTWGGLLVAKSPLLVNVIPLVRANPGVASITVGRVEVLIERVFHLILGWWRRLHLGHAETVG